MENRLQWKKAHICEKIALRNWQAAQFDKIANTQIAFTRERRQLVCDVSRQKKIQKLMTALDNFPFFFCVNLVWNITSELKLKNYVTVVLASRPMLDEVFGRDSVLLSVFVLLTKTAPPYSPFYYPIKLKYVFWMISLDFILYIITLLRTLAVQQPFFFQSFSLIA